MNNDGDSGNSDSKVMENDNLSNQMEEKKKGKLIEDGSSCQPNRKAKRKVSFPSSRNEILFYAYDPKMTQDH